MPTYLTHDNGGRPFQVVVEGKNAKVYARNKDSDGYSRLVYTARNCHHIYAFDNGKSFLKGSFVVLSLTKTRHCFIGCEIYEFSTTSDFLSFGDDSEQPSDVIYSYGMIKNTVYLFLERKYYHRAMFEPYRAYYGNIEKEAKQMKVKMIEGRRV